MFPAGRLDKDTEGFVFITDDGALSHNILSPAKHVDKVYYAILEKEADESYISAFEGGMRIDGGDVCKPAKIDICADKHEVFITISEGMYHQIKRMLMALGNNVVYLKRIQIGGVKLTKILLGSAEKCCTKKLPNFVKIITPKHSTALCLVYVKLNKIGIASLGNMT